MSSWLWLVLTTDFDLINAAPFEFKFVLATITNRKSGSDLKWLPSVYRFGGQNLASTRASAMTLASLRAGRKMRCCFTEAKVMA